MLKIIKCQKGSTLVFAAIVMVAMVGFSALAIDTGMILTADHQLQSAADAAALAGASGLLVNQSTATSRAISVSALNNCINQPVVINGANVSYPTANRILVQANRQVNLFIAPILGVRTSNVNAAALAELGKLSVTKKLKPWCIPFENWNVGEQVELKVGSHSSCGVPSYYYAVNYPPVNKGTPAPGANVYRDYIKFSYQGEVAIGDLLQVEPGNMKGPTQQGVNYLISQDPGAYWNNSLQAVVNSNFPGFSSPRILKVPFFDPANPPRPGRSEVTVAGLGSFFLEGVTNGGDVIGRFIKITTEGTNKAGPGAGLLYKAKLIQ